MYKSEQYIENTWKFSHDAREKISLNSSEYTKIMISHVIEPQNDEIGSPLASTCVNSVPGFSP